MVVQKILFGSPGTGKSHEIKNAIAPNLGVAVTSENYIPTVFHPEYTYGDFMGKLMPFTNDSGKVEYLFYRGHFLKALAQAYKNIILEFEKQYDIITDKYKKEISKTNQADFTNSEKNELETRKNDVESIEPKNVLLVIDEINRGNSAAIFGTVFQLLDRESNGWSTYPISISDLEFKGLLQEMSFKYITYEKEKRIVEEHYFNDKKVSEDNYNKYQELIFKQINELNLAKERKIKIPANLSIVATMNTSDNSIYFMDSAFKRRWDWEFIEIEDKNDLLKNVNITLDNGTQYQWRTFVDRLNLFIKSNHDKIRKIEDKQVGYRFINETSITEEKMKNKLLFFVWDSIFTSNKDPLVKLLFDEVNSANKSKLVTFGDFAKNVKLFIHKIMNNSF